MPDVYKEVPKCEWDSMLDLFEAVTGYRRNSVVAGSLRILNREDDVVAEFKTFEPTRFAPDPKLRYKDHTIRLHTGQELKETTP